MLPEQYCHQSRIDLLPRLLLEHYSMDHHLPRLILGLVVSRPRSYLTEQTLVLYRSGTGYRLD